MSGLRYNDQNRLYALHLFDQSSAPTRSTRKALPRRLAPRQTPDAQCGRCRLAGDDARTIWSAWTRIDADGDRISIVSSTSTWRVP